MESILRQFEEQDAGMQAQIKQAKEQAEKFATLEQEEQDLLKLLACNTRGRGHQKWNDDGRLMALCSLTSHRGCQDRAGDTAHAGML